MAPDLTNDSATDLDRPAGESSSARTAGTTGRRRTSLVFCTRCGQQNPPDARFCARCGNELLRPGEPVSAPDRSSEQTSTLNIAAIGASLEGEAGEDSGEVETGAAVESLPGGSAL